MARKVERWADASSDLEELERITYTHFWEPPPDALPHISRNRRIVYHIRSCPRPGDRNRPCTCAMTLIVGCPLDTPKDEQSIPHYQSALIPAKEPKPKLTPEELFKSRQRAWQKRRAKGISCAS